MRRFRKAKIVATLGPSSSSLEKIEELFKAGADVFRLNFSHGSHEDHQERVQMIRDVEKKLKRPIAIMMDLQGPKLRVGTFAEGKIYLKPNEKFSFDLNSEPGNSQRVCLPHPEIFAALKPETDLLLDDGKIRLKVLSCSKESAETLVINGGELSNRKGVNVPSVMLPISALTEKDKKDLNFGLSLGVDWVALSFVQKPEDIQEAKVIIQDKAKVIAKLEKPMAIQHLEGIVKLADAIMVARGDLGVEMMPEEVPSIQKKIIRACRVAGKPVVVATQMLDSMIHSPSPTRAEASDVAVAIYDGVDAVMLSAESASGQYPVEAVEMMNRIISKTEQDPVYREMMDNSHLAPLNTVADAITASARQVAHIINAGVIVTFSETGSTTLRAARERPESSILALTPNLDTARFLALVWGAHAALTEDVHSFSQMVETACRIAVVEKFAAHNDQIIVTAGVPFGASGGTNILRVARIEE
jgi:pyruvate kinase